MNFSKLYNQKGSAFIQIMMGVGIMGIVVAGMMAFIDHSSRATRALQQKMEILQVQQDMMRDFSDNEICACNFDRTKNVASAGVLHFDINNPNSAIDLPQLFGTCVDGVPGTPLYQAGQRLPGSPTNLTIDRIQLREFVATGTGRYRAKVEIGFDKDTLQMGRKPASVNVSLQADISNPAQARITSCSSGEGGGGEVVGTVCPATVHSTPFRGSTQIPQAPIGAAYLIEGTGGRLILPSQIACGSMAYFLCNYTTGTPQQPTWTLLSPPSCQENYSP